MTLTVIFEYHLQRNMLKIHQNFPKQASESKPFNFRTKMRVFVLKLISPLESSVPLLDQSKDLVVFLLD